MKTKFFLGMGAAVLAVAACTTNPITGRSSLQLANNSEILTMSSQEYKTTLTSSKVVKGTADANRVVNVGNKIKNAAEKYYTSLSSDAGIIFFSCVFYFVSYIYNSADANRVVNVGNKIKNAAEKYYTSIGRQADLANYAWEFNLLQDKQINAWCMPGGKVAVYTGILPITKDDTGLAVVMGHEVSHALAGHGNERISQAMVAQYGGQILGGSISNAQWAKVFETAYPIGSQVALLKYGRNQESEADQMGLYLMSMAGYDPRQSIPFWQRMEAASTGARQPEFLSTHPNPETRISGLNKNLPQALEYYKAAGGKL